MHSLFVTIKEICVIHGCKPSQATNILRDLRLAYAKEARHKITWPEYSKYYGVDLNDVKAKLNNKL